MRLFLAINPPSHVRRAIIDATSALRDAAPQLSWMDEARLHLTLKFLGEQSETMLPRLQETLDELARGHRAFAMQISDVGAFPNFRRARVVWIGIHREPRLELLHHDVEVACEQLGFALEGRSFRPHLTLARVREDASQDVLRALARAAKKIAVAETADVTTIDVMRSNLARAGARYECLHAAPLRLN